MSEIEQTDGAAEANTEQGVDYESLSLEELEEKLHAGEGVIDDTEPVEEPEPEPEPQVEEPTEAEPVEATEQDEGVPNDEVAEPVVPEFDERGTYIEELRLQSEKATADAARAELFRSREAGELGHLRKRVEELTSLLTQQPSAPTDDPYAEAQPARQQPLPSIAPVDQSRLAELESDARTVAIEAEYRDFLQAKGIEQDSAQEVLGRMSDSLREQWAPYAESVQTMAPRSARKVFRVILDSSYADMRLREVKVLREEALAKKAAQVPARKQAKQAATVSGSGASPAPRARQKAPEDMTAEEANAELIRQYGDGVHRRFRGQR